MIRPLLLVQKMTISCLELLKHLDISVGHVSHCPNHLNMQKVPLVIV